MFPHEDYVFALVSGSGEADNHILPNKSVFQYISGPLYNHQEYVLTWGKAHYILQKKGDEKLYVLHCYHLLSNNTLHV